MRGGEISALDWAKGILLSILASVIGGISKLAIRKSWLLQAKRNHNRRVGYEQLDPGDDEEQMSGRQPKISKFLPYCLRYSGMFGMSVLNPICCVLAMNYASPSILAPFSGLTLVWIIIGSPLINDEMPSNRQMLACFLIISGEVVVAVFGDHTNDESVTIEEVHATYKKPAFILYFLGLTTYIVLTAYWINYSESFSLRRFAWGCSGGAITGAQNFLKDSLTIIKATDSQKKLSPTCYPFILLAAITSFAGLLLLTACMKRYDATYSAASFVGSFVVSASIMAAVHYNTFAQLYGIVNYILYPSGIIVLMIGVYLLVIESNESSEESESTDQLRHPESNNHGVLNSDSESVFGYTEMENEAEEDILL